MNPTGPAATLQVRDRDEVMEPYKFHWPARTSVGWYSTAR